MSFSMGYGWGVYHGGYATAVTPTVAWKAKRPCRSSHLQTRSPTARATVAPSAAQDATGWGRAQGRGGPLRIPVWKHQLIQMVDIITYSIIYIKQQWCIMITINGMYKNDAVSPNWIFCVKGKSTHTSEISARKIELTRDGAKICRGLCALFKQQQDEISIFAYIMTQYVPEKILEKIFKKY